MPLAWPLNSSFSSFSSARRLVVALATTMSLLRFDSGHLKRRCPTREARTQLSVTFSACADSVYLVRMNTASWTVSSFPFSSPFSLCRSPCAALFSFLRHVRLYFLCFLLRRLQTSCVCRVSSSSTQEWDEKRKEEREEQKTTRQKNSFHMESKKEARTVETIEMKMIICLRFRTTTRRCIQRRIRERQQNKDLKIQL